MRHKPVPAVTVHKDGQGYCKVGLEEPEWSEQSSDLKLTEQFEHWLHDRPHRPAWVSDPTNAVVTE